MEGPSSGPSEQTDPAEANARVPFRTDKTISIRAFPTRNAMVMGEIMYVVGGVRC